MGIRVGHEAFYAGPDGHRVHSNLRVWIVDIYRLADQILKVVFLKPKTNLSSGQQPNTAVWLSQRGQNGTTLIALGLIPWISYQGRSYFNLRSVPILPIVQ